MKKFDIVLALVRQTRDMTLPHYGRIEAESYKSPSAHDAVTKVDKEVELFLAERLRTIDPDAAFKGEEFGGDGDARRLWLCDPIDGTGHFIRGLPFCTTMLALVEDGTVTFSVIYDFVNDVLYHATRGGGAYRNGEPIRVSERPAAGAYFSFETHLDKPANLERLARLRDKTILVKFMNCGHEFAMIASGRIEGRVSFDPWGHDWDYAAGALLVAEAGGIVANLGARTYDYRNHEFIAANRHLFAALTEGLDAVFPIA